MKAAAKLFALPVALALLAAGCITARPGGGVSASPPASEETSDEAACEEIEGQPVQIAKAKLIIEHNATDQDTGVHGAFDDHGWSELCVYDPHGRLILATSPQGQLRDLTMAGIFFESREPPNAEFSIADLEAAFPEGQYEVRAASFDGTALMGHATFTHDIPAPPTIRFPVLAEDETQAQNSVVPAAGLVVTWDPVTTTLDGSPLTVTGYEVIIVKKVEDDPNGFSRPTFDVHVPPTETALSVSPEFLDPGTVYEIEVLALEESGNQTISLGFFMTA